MTKFITKTLGCRVNQSESDALAEQLSENGCIQAREGEVADVCIINTCTVTRKAAMQSRQLIRQTRRCHPTAKILVTGCYAQTAPEEIKLLKGGCTVVGNDAKHRIPEIINTDGLAPRINDNRLSTKWLFNDLPTVGIGNRSRPILKIQDGCQAFCTYCIVPYARGPSRSLPLASALTKIQRLHQKGFHEVVLSGIHLGAYGLDLSSKRSLLDLLKRIRASQTIDRVRLSSIEPREISNQMIGWIEQSQDGPGRICPHFHIPMQSGDDGILRRMRRPYTRSAFVEVVTNIHNRLPHAAIGVDVLVGFPGETMAAFKNTLSVVADLPIAYLHVFPFSPRRGTPAFNFTDRVEAKVIKERCQRLRKLSNHKREGFYRQFEGKPLEVLIETQMDESGQLYKGTSSNYIPVLVFTDGEQQNRIVTVTVDRINGTGPVRGSVTESGKSPNTFSI